VSDDLPSRSVGSGAQTLVAAARRHLGMDFAFVAEFSAGRRVFRFVDAVPGAVRLEVGDSHALADSYCEQIVAGTIPQVIPDTSAEPTVRDLPITDQLGIGCYIGVPVHDVNGKLFGTLCCLSHVPRADLGEEHRKYLALLAEALATELELQADEPVGRDSSRRRIERVIADQSFVPVYQPIIELGTGRVVGAEIAAMRRRSLRVAIDDTGAGVSSLRHILVLQPEIIKLDLSLTIGIDTDPVRQALATALAEFGRRIGATVVAEGIDTADQLATVAGVGIELGQGYHLGRPGPLPLPPSVAPVAVRG
jgi:hypothetical protein